MISETQAGDPTRLRHSSERRMIRPSGPNAISPDNARSDSWSVESKPIKIALLTGGWDKPYALGLTRALIAKGVEVDFLGTADLDAPELHSDPAIRFFSLHGAPTGRRGDKVFRTLKYYWRTIVYAVHAKPKIFHILWCTKFPTFDRTILTLFYKVLGKRLVFTAHNVNAGKRDGDDSWWNRLTLKIQYQLTDHIFVHTERMKEELVADFQVQNHKVSVIPFGINNTVPNTDLTTAQARDKLGLGGADKAMLFFGNILPYKGLEHLLSAFTELAKECPEYRLIIAGKPKVTPRDCQNYWSAIQEQIAQSGVCDRIIERFEYIPDEQTEIFFKAADVLILPYTHIFQSGVLFLSYNFGLPVIASEVGSLKDEIIEGTTGFTCRPRDSQDLKRAIRNYFSSALCEKSHSRRRQVRDFATGKYSWQIVAKMIGGLYEKLLGQ